MNFECIKKRIKYSQKPWCYLHTCASVIFIITAARPNLRVSIVTPRLLRLFRFSKPDTIECDCPLKRPKKIDSFMGSWRYLTLFLLAWRTVPDSSIIFSVDLIRNGFHWKIRISWDRNKKLHYLKYCQSLATIFSHFSSDCRIPCPKNSSSLEAILELIQFFLMTC